MRIAHIITRMIVGGAQENTLFTCQDLLSDWGDEYPTANPLCWEKLHRNSTADISPLILSAGALDHPHYAELRERDSLTHLDGLHRMLAWGLEGRLPRFRRLEAYVVGLNRY
jgi:hypothetical protein